MDIDVPASAIQDTVKTLLADYPGLDTVIFSAGIQREFDLKQPSSFSHSDFASELRGTGVQVVEIMPPLVESELHDHTSATTSLSARWMLPLAEFTSLTLEGLKKERADTDPIEIPVGGSQRSYDKWEAGKKSLVDMIWKGRPAKD